jgi:hypothetical protein
MLEYENLITILYIFDRINRNSGNMSTAKLIYLAEEELFRKKMIGPRYKLYKYQMGPYNKTIGTQLKNLALNNYLGFFKDYYEKTKQDEKIYYANNNTSYIIKELDDLIQEYSKIFDVLDEIIEEFGDMNSEELMNFVYSLKKAGIKKKPIKKYNNYNLILDPTRIQNPLVNFKLEKDWYETVEILLNPDLYRLFFNGIKTLKHCEFKPL